MALLYVKVRGDYLPTGLPLFLDLSFSKMGTVCILSLAEAELQPRPGGLQNLGALFRSRLSCWFGVGELGDWKWKYEETQERTWTVK